MQREWLLGGIGAALLLAWSTPADAFIETKLSVADMLAQSPNVFLVRVEKIDSQRPAAVFKFERDLKGKCSYQRFTVNLTGDKEKHTPELLKRLAPDLPVLVFLAPLQDRQHILAYTNGTWFQVIGHPDGNDVRWAFTHCEIYLRRAFKGTTAELEQTLTDAIANRKAPPPYDPKVPPGFGPVIEEKREEKKQGAGATGDDSPLTTYYSAPATHQSMVGQLFAVIALPFLMPIAAVLQLLFPGLLRDKWQEYKVAVYVLITQSTVIFLQFGLKWAFGNPSWLRPEVLWGAIILVTLIGLVIAWRRTWKLRGAAGAPTNGAPPTRVEYIAVVVLLVAGLAWGACQYWFPAWSDTRPFCDPMGVVTLAAGVAFLHLVFRSLRASQSMRPAYLTTELALLGTLFLGGSAMAAYLFQPAPPNLHAHAVATDWPTARGNAQRTGSLRPDDPGPSNPTVLWTFDPSERSGRVMIHSTPTVVDDLLYVGALHQVLTFDSGYVYCVRADTGERIWRFTAGNSLRPVFSSPTVAGGKIYVGEGYHQDQRCRLFSLDAQSGDRIVWRRQARSHVESSPCIVGSRVYFGAGDDGLICVDESQLEEAEGGPPQPRLVWEVPGIHVDVSPLVVDGRVFAGSTVGDKHQVLLAVGVDATSGQTLWQTRSEMRITGSPGYADGRVYFGLGTGKLGQEGDHPHGGVWSLDAASGKEHWLFRTPASVMSTPALMNGHVYFGGTDSHCYCLKQTDGSMVWKQPMPGPVAASAVVAAGKVYVLTTTGTLLCLNAGDGDTLWKLADFAGAEVDDAYASPTLVNGRLYLALGGKVYCVGDR